MLTSQAQVTVRYAETDMMGVVYHANYLPWLEIGRTTLLREYGLPYRALEEMGYRLPVLEIAAKYLRPAVYDDTLTILTTMREKPILRLVLDYEVRRGNGGGNGAVSDKCASLGGEKRVNLGGAAGDANAGDGSGEVSGQGVSAAPHANPLGELLATARSVHAFIDSQGRPTRPPPLFVEKMNAAFGG